MKITERLNVEHGVFLKQLDHLERLLREGAPRPVLAAVVQTIGAAMQPHCDIEERSLCPALAEVLGSAVSPLSIVTAKHEDIEELRRVIDSGAFDEADVDAFVRALREHMEEEIHVLFPMAEEWLPPERLVSMSNWNVEHVRERAARHERARPERRPVL